MGNPFYGYEGRRFGRLIVLSRAENSKSDAIQWKCLCDCGNNKIIAGSSLRTGLTRSCGCLYSVAARNRKDYHGGRGTREYRAWRNMIARCSKKAVGHDRRNYFLRGITVCSQWRRSFPVFLENMGRCPTGYSIERMNNNLGYSPDNCIWATCAVQSRNTRRNRYIEGFGERRLLCDWSQLLKIQAGSLLRSIQSGRTLEQITRRSVLRRSDRKV